MREIIFEILLFWFRMKKDVQADIYWFMAKIEMQPHAEMGVQRSIYIK